MANGTKRIKDLPAISLNTGLSIPVDSNNGTRRISSDDIKTPLTNIPDSDTYSNTTAYKKGNFVIHDNMLYKCTTSCSANNWATNRTYFVRSTITDAISTANELAGLVTLYRENGTVVHNSHLKTKMITVHSSTGYGNTGIDISHIIQAVPLSDSYYACFICESWTSGNTSAVVKVVDTDNNFAPVTESVNVRILYIEDANV